MSQTVKVKRKTLIEKYKQERPDFQDSIDKVSTLAKRLITFRFLYIAMIALYGIMLGYVEIEYFIIDILILTFFEILQWLIIIICVSPVYWGRKIGIYFVLITTIFNIVYRVLITMIAGPIIGHLNIWVLLLMITEVAIASKLLSNSECRTYFEIMSAIRKERRLERKQKSQ